MNLDNIRELITLMRKNRIKEIDFEQEGSKIRIVASEPAGPAAAKVVPAPESYLFTPQHPGVGHYGAIPQQIAPPPEVSNSGESPAASQNGAPAPVAEAASPGVEIKSPMVGTFYRAPAPDAPPYVDAGGVINPDTVICIIEAMKLMNEVKAETRGKVLKVLAENGQPVEFGQPLFLVEPFI